MKIRSKPKQATSPKTSSKGDGPGAADAERGSGGARWLTSHERSAYCIACDEHVNNFKSRRGSGEWADDSGCTIGFYVFDNNPWAHDADLRDRQYAELTAIMAKRGCRLVGHAKYPKTGDSAGYTLAMIFISATPKSAAADHEVASDFTEKLVGQAYADTYPRQVLS